MPGVLCQCSEIILWKLLNIQMIFWWICGWESGLPILFFHHLGTTSLLFILPISKLSVLDDCSCTWRSWTHNTHKALWCPSRIPHADGSAPQVFQLYKYLQSHIDIYSPYFLPVPQDLSSLFYLALLKTGCAGGTVPGLKALATQYPQAFLI